MKTLDELRGSEFHQQLGQKIWAAFLAQQQGISLNTALKKVEAPVCDSWLMVAEFARHAYDASVEECYPGQLEKQFKRLDHVTGEIAIA
jgi:hypothetical protein